jgi:hypothetical protein
MIRQRERAMILKYRGPGNVRWGRRGALVCGVVGVVAAAATLCRSGGTAGPSGTLADHVMYNRDEADLAIMPMPAGDGFRLSSGNIEGICAVLDLRRFAATSVALDEDGLRFLAGQANLESLTLQNVKLTTMALRQIAKLRSLKQLGLIGTGFTDDQIQELRPLERLARLDLTGNRVTASGIARLRESLPNCEIVAVAIAPAAEENGDARR